MYENGTIVQTGQGKFSGILDVTYSVQAEMSTLGAMLLSGRAVKEVRSVLTAGDFYVPAHQTVFEAICALDDAGKPVDFVTLEEALTVEDKGGTIKIDMVGGLDYLVEIAESVPSAVNALHYAGIVKEKWALRTIADGARSVFDSIREGEASSAISGKLVDVARAIAARATGTEASQLMAVPLEGGDSGIPVGLPSLERGTTCRGVPCGQVTVVKAATGVGKTPMLTQMALHAAKEGFRVCYATFADLTPTQWKRRILKTLTGHTSPTTLESVAVWDDALATVNDPYGEGAIMVYDGQSNRDAGQVENFVAWFEAEHQKERFGLLCIDYIQKVRTKDPKMTPFERVTFVGDEFDQLAKRLGDRCAVVLGSQVTQVGDTNRTRYGTEVENDAGLIIEIVRELGHADTVLRITKNRFGDPFQISNVTFDLDRLVFIDPKSK